MDDATLDEYKKSIDQYTAQLATADKLDPSYAFDGKSTEETREGRKAIYVELEAQVAATQKELTDKYNAAAAAEAIAAIEAIIETVEDNKAAVESALASLHAPVATANADEIDNINETIANIEKAVADVKAELEEYGTGKILTYNAIVTGHANAANQEVTSIKSQADALTALDEANESAKAAVDASIKEVEDALAQAITTIDALENVKAENYQTMIDNIASDIEDAKGTAAEEYNAVNVDYAWDNTDKLSSVAQLVKLATYNDVASDIQARQNCINDELYPVINKEYPADVANELNNQYSALTKKRDYIEDYNQGMYDDGFVAYDVNGNRIVDEDGIPTTLSADYLTEVVPAVREALAELDEMIAAFKKLALENTFVKGDANADGIVDISDYNAVIGHILEREGMVIEEGTKEYRGADANGDGVIRIGDATSIVQIIKAGYGVKTAAMARAMRQDDNDAVSVMVADNGTTQRLAINLSNSRNYVACQMDIVLPQGVTIASEALAARAEALDLSSNDVKSGAHRVVLSSFAGNVIEGNEGAVLYLDLNVTSTYDGAPIVIEGIEAVDTQMRTFLLGNVEADAATGIHTVTMMQDMKNRIYNVGGQLMNGMKRGINIIVGEDGAAKKVVKK